MSFSAFGSASTLRKPRPWYGCAGSHATGVRFGTEPGVASSHNFFEALYPWPERITAVSDVPLPNFAQAFPMVVRGSQHSREGRGPWIS